MPERSRELFQVPDRVPQWQRARVLLVQREADLRRALAAALVAHGLTVDEARSARDALAIAGYAPPDVVVYDLGWGRGLHQLDELGELVEEQGRRAPTVVLTTPDWVRVRRGITLRAPVMDEIVSAVRRALAERRPRAR